MPTEQTQGAKWILYQSVEAFRHATALDYVDMAAVIAIAYVILAALARTRAGRMAWGVAFLLTLYWVASMVLPVVTWLMGMALVPGVVGLIILFQGELRTFLSHLGSLLVRRTTVTEDTCHRLIAACLRMSKDHTGALIAIERSTPLAEAMATGIFIDADISAELLRAIFVQNGPLHDGGVIVCNQRLTAAACQFPASTNPELDVTFGMRHRAAIGITESSDCLCLVVSEETGAVSLAMAGEIQYDLPREELEAVLRDLVGEQPKRRALSIRREVSDD